MASSFSHPRERRLVLARDFQHVYRAGGRARGASLVVVACENGLPLSRLGLSVGKTIWKSAVKRNRIRRIFREAFRLEYAELPVGIDLILIPPRPKFVPVLAEIRAEIATLARQAIERRASGARRAPREAT